MLRRCTGEGEVLPEFLVAATEACQWADKPVVCLQHTAIPTVEGQRMVMDVLQEIAQHVPLDGATGAVFRLLADGNAEALTVLLQLLEEYHDRMHEVQMMVNAVLQ